MRKFKLLFTITLSGILMLIMSNLIVILKSKPFLYENATTIPKREFALVLGTSKNGKFGLNPYFKHRMDATIELWRQKKVKKIIVSGDNHIKGYNETEDMRDYLINAGVPKEIIICDYAGFRTLDSVVRSKKVFQCNSVIIVSQKFHNERALYIANNYDIDAIAFNAQDIGSTKNITHFREVFAKFLVILDIHYFKRNPKFF